MDKVKISAVSYTNTKPFIHGILQSDIRHKIALSLDIPTDCATKLIQGQVDIGLIPVAAIPFILDSYIVSDYCIGSVGAVNSVFVLSNVPMEEIRTVKLDEQSRTSNNLARVLFKNHWKRKVSFVSGTDQTDAVVLIGDRTFQAKDNYPYVYDMGQAWMDFTNLPFVYAAWVSNKPISDQFIAEFNAALSLGLAQRDAVIATLPPVAGIDLEDYLWNKLDFAFTPQKRQALELFLSYVSRL